MHGNVGQWCQDWLGLDDPQEHVVDPQGPEKGEARVLRGGAWHLDSLPCRSAARFWNGSSHRDPYIGFRLCFCLD
jgi:formylglycine-generating enzyme required for sulfatase activity